MRDEDIHIQLVSQAINARLNGAITEKEYGDIVSALEDSSKRDSTYTCLECSDTLVVLKEDHNGRLTCYSCRCCRNPRYKKA